jgi:hypothetical protein
MSDPPIICFWKWIGWKYYKVKKIVIWRVFLPKPKFFSHPPNTYPPYVPVGPTFAFHVAAHPELKKTLLHASSRQHSHGASSPGGGAPHAGHHPPLRLLVTHPVRFVTAAPRRVTIPLPRGRRSPHACAAGMANRTNPSRRAST